MAHHASGEKMPYRPKNKNLSAREEQVARLLTEGKTCREIAQQIGIELNTVDTHRGHVLKKLGLKTTVELVLHGVAAGWVSPRLAPNALAA